MVNYVRPFQLRSFLLLALTLVLAGCGSSSPQAAPTERGQQDSKQIIIEDTRDLAAELAVSTTTPEPWTPQTTLTAQTASTAILQPSPEPSSTPKPILTRTPKPAQTSGRAPQIVSFTASPSPAEPTGMVTLRWQVTGADSVTLRWTNRNKEGVEHHHLPL